MQGMASLDEQDLETWMMGQLTPKLCAVICKLLMAVSARCSRAGNMHESTPDAVTFTLPAPPYWTAQLRDWYDKVKPEVATPAVISGYKIFNNNTSKAKIARILRVRSSQTTVCSLVCCCKSTGMLLATFVSMPFP
jgi:hypothetical protein